MIKVHILLVVAVVVGFFAVVPVTTVEASHEGVCSGQTTEQCALTISLMRDSCAGMGAAAGTCFADAEARRVHNEAEAADESAATTETEFENVTFQPPEREGINFAWNNPLSSDITDGGIAGLITAILDALVVLLVPIITLMIIYSGFMYVTARGNAEQVKKATASLTYAIIGAILVLGAVLLSDIIRETIQSIG